MAITTSYSDARARFAKIWDEVVDGNETAIIKRRGKSDIAIISLSELNSLKESVHLLRSPKNAERLSKALERAELREGKESSLNELKKDLEFE